MSCRSALAVRENLPLELPSHAGSMARTSSGGTWDTLELLMADVRDSEHAHPAAAGRHAHPHDGPRNAVSKRALSTIKGPWQRRGHPVC